MDLINNKYVWLLLIFLFTITIILFIYGFSDKAYTIIREKMINRTSYIRADAKITGVYKVDNTIIAAPIIDTVLTMDKILWEPEKMDMEKLIPATLTSENKVYTVLLSVEFTADNKKYVAKLLPSIKQCVTTAQNISTFLAKENLLKLTAQFLNDEEGNTTIYYDVADPNKCYAFNPNSKTCGNIETVIFE